MSDLKQIYHQLILENNRNPASFGIPKVVTHSAEGHNPFCGDQLRVYIQLHDDRIESIGFTGDGCAIAIASASLMCKALSGKCLSEATALHQALADMLNCDGQDPAGLGELSALIGVREFPTRVKCATLAWSTLVDAINTVEKTDATDQSASIHAIGKQP